MIWSTTYEQRRSLFPFLNKKVTMKYTVAILSNLSSSSAFTVQRNGRTMSITHLYADRQPIMAVNLKVSSPSLSVDEVNYVFSEL